MKEEGMVVFLRDVSVGFMFCRKPMMLLPFEEAVAAAISDYKRQPTLYPPAANEPCVFMRSVIRLPNSHGPQQWSSIEFYIASLDATNSRACFRIVIKSVKENTTNSLNHLFAPTS